MHQTVLRKFLILRWRECQACRGKRKMMAATAKKSRVKATVASMLPIALAVAANTPASTNIHIISRTLLLPAPREKGATRSSMPPFVMKSA